MIVANRAAADVEVGLEHHTLRVAFGVGAQLEHFGENNQLLEQLVDAEGLESRDLDCDRVSAPSLGHEPVLGQLLKDAIGIGVRPVDLVDRHHDRRVGGLGVVDRFHRLRHHPVVGRDDEHDDVGDTRTSRPHSGEGFMAGSVDESQQVTLPFNLIGADVLSDATGFAGSHVRLADPVEQQSLAVVDVAHDGDDRGPRLLIVVLFLFLVAEELRSERGLLLLAGVDQSDLRADLSSEEVDHVVGQRLGRRDHFALEQEEAHDVARGAVQTWAELLWRGSPLHDHLVVGNWGARGQVGRDLDRLELFHVAAAATWPALRRAPAPDGTASRRPCGTARGVATGARAGCAATSVLAAARTAGISRRELSGRARETRTSALPRVHLAACGRPGAGPDGTRRARAEAAAGRSRT